MLQKRIVLITCAIALTFGASTRASAQHEGHPMPADTTKKKPAAKPKPKASAQPKKKPARTVNKTPAKAVNKAAAMKDSMPMKPMLTKSSMSEGMMTGPLGISMDRMGSGTTWIPDAVTLPSRQKMFGKWEVMAHGFVFGQYDHQSGPRGDDQLGSLNWTMLMASRKIAGGHFQARTMLSLDPWTVTKKGYPLLLQSGETFGGEALHDRQHPHDFFMELAALYQRQINDRVALSIYAAPSGEPALGPVAFMHRPSAMDNPAAPLSHHWQDATHVSFGVITGGILTRRWQLEASAFNGREPDEERWNFDPIKIDSYSGRLTVNPTRSFSVTAGYGYLKSPEALHPEESLHRLTASVLHGTQSGSDRQITSALIWGANDPSGDSKTTHSVLLENESILDARNTIFGRAELVQKKGEDLDLTGEASEDRFNVGAIQVGYIRELTRIRWSTIGIGAAATLNVVPSALEDAYGARSPVGTFIFVRLRPFHLRSSSSMPMKMNAGEDSQ